MVVTLPARHRLLAGVTALFAFSLLLYLFFAESPALPTVPAAISSNTYPPHPVDDLIKRATADFNRLLDARSTTLRDAVARYRQRRGRHPPPEFDAWFDFATSRNALLVEDFFDQIYDDLEPFWGMPPRDIRAEAAKSEDTVISVRNATVTKTVRRDSWRIHNWADLVDTIVQAASVPDLDLPVNVMDESRILVPWTDVDALVRKAAAERHMPLDPSAVLDSFGRLDGLPDEPAAHDWETDFSRLWSLVQAACPPDSPARGATAQVDLSVPAAEYLPLQHPFDSWHGYVSNWTTARDPCFHPHLRGLHGTFVEQVSTKTSTRLLPLFGGSKLRVNNDILLPAAMYWGDWTEYSGGEDHGNAWRAKTDGFVWRGVASGGRNREGTWPYFHRHRFISMANATTVATAEAQNGESITFKLPPPNLYHVQAAEEGGLGAWLGKLSNAGFNDLWCFPQEPDRRCSYSEAQFSIVDGMSMADQYNFKFLPDVDGNSYSARFRAFLLSTSLPIKATIYREWHDARLFPWVHFVPMDNTFIDFYGILEYFVGAPSHQHPARDDVARKLAAQGQDWAQQVLRREDMQIYMYRLLLEYARVCDDNRLRLGYIADL